MSRRSIGVDCFGSDSRAVSETLGYILVFSLIIGTITAATVFGFSGLNDRQAAEQVTNVERAFDVLADNFKDISRHEDPSRATEIRLAGGTIQLGKPVTVTVGEWNDSTSMFESQTSTTLQPIVYASDGGIIVYEAGMIFRVDGNRSVSRTKTPFAQSESATIIPIAVTRPGDERAAISSDRTILVTGERRPNTIPLANRTVDISEGNELRVVIDSPRADGWQRQLIAEGVAEDDIEYDPAAGRVSVTLDSERATLAATPIDVYFRR